MKNNITKLLLGLVLITLPLTFINAQNTFHTPRVYLAALGGSSLMGRGDYLRRLI
jgi:hypothetical protein